MKSSLRNKVSGRIGHLSFIGVYTRLWVLDLWRKKRVKQSLWTWWTVAKNDYLLLYTWLFLRALHVAVQYFTEITDLIRPIPDWKLLILSNIKIPVLSFQWIQGEQINTLTIKISERGDCTTEILGLVIKI